MVGEAADGASRVSQAWTLPPDPVLMDIRMPVLDGIEATRRVAAKIVGETANVARFRSDACVAMHAGVAPIPASSGRTTRHRLARGGNRQLNAALHRIAVTQIRLDGPGRAYFQWRRGNGDTTMEALRAVKRRLARVVFNLLRPEGTIHPAARPTAA